MNPADILGEILKGGGSGGILKDILTGGSKGRPEPRSAPSSGPSSSSTSLEDYQRQIRELEEDFGITGGSQRPSPRSDRWKPKVEASTPPPLPKRQPDKTATEEQHDTESIVLIRAMIHAAKADGRLSREEQSAVFKKLGGQSTEATRFFQDELNKPTNVRDFAWSVPMGMEYKVYAISLAAIDLDTKRESAYLSELAHGLRLPLEVRQHLHERYGAPAPE
jgi:hypothetical protein